MVGEWRLRLALELMSLWRYVELAARFDPLGPDLRRDKMEKIDAPET
jgi:hypothetical protein